MNNATFAKSDYVDKIIYGVCPFSQTSGLTQVWLVWEEWWLEDKQFDSAYAILDPPVCIVPMRCVACFRVLNLNVVVY